LTHVHDEPVKILGIVVKEVGEPRFDEIIGAEVYDIPFQLSRTPSSEWGQAFLRAWDTLPDQHAAHWPRIANVGGDKIILSDTTIEDVEQSHLESLKRAVAEANRLADEEERRLLNAASTAGQRKHAHHERIAEIAKRLRFHD
jgi:hypothetical protein